MPAYKLARLLVCCLLAGSWQSLRAGQTVEQPPRSHVFFRVQLPASASAAVAGRLLVFLKAGSGDSEVDTNPFHPEAASVAAREVDRLAPGDSIEVDADQTAFPKPFSTLAAGDYEVQAVLDVGHTYNYSGRSPEDWVSGVISLPHWSPGGHTEPTLMLDRHPPVEERRSSRMKKLAERAKQDVAQKVEFKSPILSRFWGHPVFLRAWVILPPGYEAGGARYPTAYWTHGFGGDLDYCLFEGMTIHDRMLKGTMPPMIWVMLDESLPEGTHEFADSVNNGAWGTALTTELLPYLERKYRMDARRNSRLLNGHSSGGWATLQLQVNYPQIFGGTWSTSPDPSDFHDFTGPNLYAAHANVYRKPDGGSFPIMREGGKVIATFQQFSELEAVLGPYGGQVSSFEWVFSPRGDNGAPQPMFDRQTGDVDPKVAAYWCDHYDLAHIVEKNWASRGSLLKGRIHLIVGTADTFYLDGAAHKFEAVLQRLGAEPRFTFLPERTHFDLYTVGEDKTALFDRIASEMYAVARPNEHWHPKS